MVNLDPQMVDIVKLQTAGSNRTSGNLLSRYNVKLFLPGEKESHKVAPLIPQGYIPRPPGDALWPLFFQFETRQ